MKRLETSEILDLVEYERVRETRRREIIELKKPRRVSVGRYLTFVFENRETVWFQVQEMVRAERIVDDAKIAEEVEVYNALLPGPGELAATMLIEITASAEIKPVLDKLLGIDTRDYVRLTVGPHVVVGAFEGGHSDEERGNSPPSTSYASRSRPAPAGSSARRRSRSSSSTRTSARVRCSPTRRSAPCCKISRCKIHCSGVVVARSAGTEYR